MAASRRSVWSAVSTAIELTAQFLEQRLGFLEVCGVEALGEPAIDVVEHRAGLVTTTLLRNQPCEARASTKFKSSRAHALGKQDRLAEISGRLGLVATPHVQLAARPQHIEQIDLLFSNCPKGLLDGRERLLRFTHQRPRLAMCDEPQRQTRLVTKSRQRIESSANQPRAFVSPTLLGNRPSATYRCYRRVVGNLLFAEES